MCLFPVFVLWAMLPALNRDWLIDKENLLGLGLHRKLSTAGLVLEISFSWSSKFFRSVPLSDFQWFSYPQNVTEYQ